MISIVKGKTEISLNHQEKEKGSSLLLTFVLFKRSDIGGATVRKEDGDCQFPGFLSRMVW
jgi:hypothetical protein